MKKKRIQRKCPTYKHFFMPVLKALQDLGGSAANDEIYKRILMNENFRQEVVDEMHSFTQTQIEYNIAWARTYLRNYGAIESSRYGVWVLTSKGAALARAGSCDVKEIAKFTNMKHKGESSSSTDEDVPNFVAKPWREKIIEILQNMDPYAFERLSQRLLRECGFTDVEVTQKSGDGGIDGVGKLRINGIFSFNVAFQCKRYKGQVGAPQIRDFRGSLGTNIEKGVLITTGTFSSKAKEEASSEGKRLIDLMDGEEFINKLAEYGIGLKEVRSYEVDEDFFNSIAEE